MTPGQKVSAIDIVKESWGDSIPGWVMNLAQECDRSSQSQAAKKIGRSASLVNQVLKNKYNGSLSSIQERCEAALSCEVECPIMGLISGTKCLATQEMPYQPYNHVVVRQFRACRNCPHLIKKEAKRNEAE